MTPDQTGAVLAQFAAAMVEALGLGAEDGRTALQQLAAILTETAGTMPPGDERITAIGQCHSATASILRGMLR